MSSRPYLFPSATVAANIQDRCCSMGLGLRGRNGPGPELARSGHRTGCKPLRFVGRVSPRYNPDSSGMSAVLFSSSGGLDESVNLSRAWRRGWMASSIDFWGEVSEII